MSIKHSKQEIAQKVASHLLKIGAIKLNTEQPFQWASGWKSPIYCDNRLTLSYPSIRSLLKKYLIDEIRSHFGQVEVIAGVATAGIPQSALIADELELPLVYVRSKPKGHGMENLIEGQLEPGKKVVVIEDLVSTGGSSLKAAQAIQDAGGEVLGMVAIFTYGFKQAEENFKKANIDLVTISNYQQLLKQAYATEYIKAGELKMLENWREDPANWG